MHYTADFETTTPRSTLYDETDDAGHSTPLGKEEGTRVWAAAMIPAMGDPSPRYVVHTKSIDDFIVSLSNLNSDDVIWFHNLTFDISFLLPALMSMGYELHETDKPFNKPPRGKFVPLVSDSGKWYSMRITLNGSKKSKVIEFRDSLKIMPFPLDGIAKSLKTKYQKLIGSIDYEKERPPGYSPTQEEIDYINNDVMVLSEAIHKLSLRDSPLTDSLTIGGACMKEVFRVWGNGDVKKGRKTYRSMMPELSPIDDAPIRKGYKGGWCINNTSGTIVGELDGDHRGHTLDVNSLYPSVMRGNSFPVGFPVPLDPSDFNSVRSSNSEWFVRFEAEFTVKVNHVPFVQDKSTMFGDQTHIRDSMGMMELTMSRPDYELFTEQYDIHQMEVLDIWAFNRGHGIFDEYVDHWYEVKRTAKAAGDEVATITAKLMLNNLYGKMAQSPVRGSGIPYIDEKGVLKYEAEEAEASGGYIPAGAYITAYARCVTVRAAQRIIDSGRRFCYADTDSVHFVGDLDGLEQWISIGDGIGQWDHEGSWDCARFVRQKTYTENIVHPAKEVGLLIKAAGCPESVKERMRYRVTDGETFHRITKNDEDNITNEPRPTMEIIERFQPGLMEAGKLRRKSVPGGVVLEETTFRIHVAK